MTDAHNQSGTLSQGLAPSEHPCTRIREQCYRIWEHRCFLCFGMPPLSPHSLSSLTQSEIKLQSGANDARSDDTSKLKVVVADWLNSRTPSGARISSKAKEERGINNDVTGCLLCPIDFDWDDPRYVPAFLHMVNLTIHLVSVQNYEMRLRNMTSPQVFSSGVYTRERREIQTLLRRAS